MASVLSLTHVAIFGACIGAALTIPCLTRSTRAATMNYCCARDTGLAAVARCPRILAVKVCNGLLLRLRLSVRVSVVIGVLTLLEARLLAAHLAVLEGGVPHVLAARRAVVLLWAAAVTELLTLLLVILGAVAAHCLTPARALAAAHDNVGARPLVRVELLAAITRGAVL